jgi:phosphonate transport system ATP-binding protein
MRRDPKEVEEKARHYLGKVGIAEKCDVWPAQLSGGQQQRAAIARALVQGAQVVLADEPIASLDPASCRRVMEQLATLNRESGVTVLVSLHQVQFAFAYCPRTVALRAGEVVFDGPTADLSAQRLTELYGEQTDELLSHDDQDAIAAARRRSTVPALRAA